MRLIERRTSASVAPPSLSSSVPPTKNELLDRENHSVVEILTREEFLALKRWWPASSSSSVFAMSFAVDAAGCVSFGVPPCRDCDATGRSHAISIKNRARGWIKRSADKPRAPASLEY
jgi:hypothetical protein